MCNRKVSLHLSPRLQRPLRLEKPASLNQLIEVSIYIRQFKPGFERSTAWFNVAVKTSRESGFERFEEFMALLLASAASSALERLQGRDWFSRSAQQHLVEMADIRLQPANKEQTGFPRKSVVRLRECSYRWLIYIEDKGRFTVRCQG